MEGKAEERGRTDFCSELCGLQLLSLYQPKGLSNIHEGKPSIFQGGMNVSRGVLVELPYKVSIKYPSAV